MTLPNLFSFATSELSQDAFICWLLSWAKPENKELDANLHACGVALIQKFFEKHGKSFPVEVRSVEVEKQYKNIDVLCTVNGEFPIIIEDKKKTSNHSDQLARYISTIANRKDKNRNLIYKPENIICIYFKTYDQASYKNVIDKNKYQNFSRKDFLEILNMGSELGVDSDIFHDYRSNLQSLEDDVQSYITNEPHQKWSEQSWVGFYIKLQQELVSGSWRKIINPSGGYMGFTLGFMKDKPYLHLQEEKLCFKIEVSDKTKRKFLRKKWYEEIQSHAKSFELTLNKPARFGSGKNMTVIIAKGDYRCKDVDGRIDIDATIRKLRDMDVFLKSIQSMDVTF